MSLVPRSTLVIGDLHGSLSALAGNLLGAGALDRKGLWNRPNCDVVLLGDAICDRGEDDLEVAKAINELRQEVAALGGECITLMGNHDAMGLAFLTAHPKDYSFHRDDQYKGAAALAKPVHYLTAKSPEAIRKERVGLIEREGRDRFLGRFKTSARGREVLRYLLNLDLYAIRGSTLFVHTPPTEAMLKRILQDDGTLNSTVRKVTAHALRMNGAPDPSPEERREFVAADTFLNANNRSHAVPSPSHAIWRDVRDAGIERIFFGHDFLSQGEWATHKDVKLHGVDTFYGRPYGSSLCAAVWVEPNGGLRRFQFPCP